MRVLPFALYNHHATDPRSEIIKTLIVASSIVCHLDCQDRLASNVSMSDQVTTGPVVPSYLYLYRPSPSAFSELTSRGTHSLWTSAPSPTLREGACNQVSCLDLWVRRISHQFQVGVTTRPIHWQSVVGPLLSAPPIAFWHTGPFTCASLNPPFLPFDSSPDLMPYVQQRNADQHIVFTDSGTPNLNVPWDPGVSVNRRQIPTHVPTAPAPPPPSTPADGSHLTLTRHKDRGDSMYRVSKGKRSDAAGDGPVSSGHVRNTNDEDKSDLPFVPHHTSPDPLVHHPSTTQLTHASGVPTTSRATNIVPHPVR
jgi:hypothetical protein